MKRRAAKLAIGHALQADGFLLFHNLADCLVFNRPELARADLPASRPFARVQHPSGAQKAADVAQVMGRTSENLGPTRAELINMGLLYTPQHGYAAFTVPHFDRFMLRAVPTLEVPPIRRRRQT